ncbi:MAG: AMP-binding protein, partial [Bacteroidales bacterium]|nr:AMP-binding protein [Bacteroidales bacterium]
MAESLNQLLKASILKNCDHKALCDAGKSPLSYREMAEKIANIHLFLKEAGIKPQDKIALCGRNSASWSIAFLGTMTYGAVPVPILNDFKAESIHNIVNHSDARILWADDAILNAVTLGEMGALEAVVQLGDNKVVYSKEARVAEYMQNIEQHFAEKYPNGYSKDDVEFIDEQPEDIALINYTSGSTGFSKGVILPYRALWSNVRFAIDNITYLKADDGMINMLPLAHMYGLAIEMLFPLCKGCYVYFLGKTPSPKILMAAFAQVQPKLIIAVPLILEKIIR